MGMFCNGANCDIYIGKGAGTMLFKDIKAARESVKIVSPYLSPGLVKELIEYKQFGLDIQLITTDKIEDFYGDYQKNIYKLIRQHRSLDTEAEDSRNKWIKISKIILYSTAALIIIGLTLGLYLENIKVLGILLPIIVLGLIYKLYQKKIDTKRIYSYHYSQLFPFKVYMSPNENGLSDTFIHSKIYLIDDAIAYLGSLNFTGSGKKYNYETRIKTTDHEAVRKIRNEFYDLFHRANIPERDIQMWGRSIYKEPIN